MKRWCLVDGCHTLTAKTYCALHTPKRGYRPQYDGEWQRLSRQVRAEQPWCSRCGATADLTVDHVVPRSLRGGVQVLCRSCNSRKSDHRG